MKGCRALLGLGILVLASCGSLMDSADEAYAREDWDKAIELYTKILAKEDELPKIQELKNKIAMAKQQAGAAHAREAQNRLTSKEFELAYESAEKAYGYESSSSNAKLRASIRRDYARHLFSQAKAQLDSGFLEDALQSIEKAHGLDPSPEYTSLLQELRARTRKGTRSSFADLVAKANGLFDRMSWSEAVNAYTQALSVRNDSLASRKREFALLIIEAEGKRRSNPSEARKLLERAKEMGFHRTYVETRLKGLR